MKLSIIVPVYRVEATLDRCLQSIVDQSYNDFEVILVDDGSPDECPAICDRWAAHDNRIRVVHQANGGLSAARNAGLDLAQGEFVTFVDSDDYLAATTLAEIMPIAEDTDLLEYPIWVHYGSADQTFLPLRHQEYASPAEYWLQAEAYLHTYACNKIYRRWLFKDVRFPIGRVFEDAFTLPQLLKLSPRIMTTDRGTYFYCDNPQGITSTAQGRQLSQLLDAHLSAEMPMDDNYYMRLLNIQMDVYELTGEQPRLPYRHVCPTGSATQRLKAITQNLLGIKGICRINKIIHHFRQPSRS